MAVEAVVFDVGETLVDETGMWMRAAELTGLPAFTVMGVIGGLGARGEHHERVWELLGAGHPELSWTLDEWYPDALPCIARLREEGLRVGAAGNTPATVEQDLRTRVDFAGSSAGWGVKKPSPEFFDRLAEAAGVAPEKIAYVGDRVDNDVLPALAAGMTAVHIRRGPWGYLDNPPSAALRIRSLSELPGVLRV